MQLSCDKGQPSLPDSLVIYRSNPVLLRLVQHELTGEQVDDRSDSGLVSIPNDAEVLLGLDDYSLGHVEALPRRPPTIVGFCRLDFNASSFGRQEVSDSLCLSLGLSNSCCIAEAVEQIQGEHAERNVVIRPIVTEGSRVVHLVTGLQIEGGEVRRLGEPDLGISLLKLRCESS